MCVCVYMHNAPHSASHLHEVIVHYMVHCMVHCIVHCIVHYIVHYYIHALEKHEVGLPRLPRPTTSSVALLAVQQPRYCTAW